MKRMYRRVVIESPFGARTREGQDENLRYLRACMRDCLDRGEAPFASHGLYTQEGVLDDWDPAEREKGIRAGFEWRTVAQATIVYADRGISQGMRAGIRAAVELQSGGLFDHDVEYRLLGGEWSSLGGPEEIKKHLSGLYDDHQKRHRHLALVEGPHDETTHIDLIAEEPEPTPTVPLNLSAAERAELMKRTDVYDRSRLPNPDDLPGGMLAPEVPTSGPEPMPIPAWTPAERAEAGFPPPADFQQQPPELTPEERATIEREARSARCDRPRDPGYDPYLSYRFEPKADEEKTVIGSGIPERLPDDGAAGAGVPTRTYTREVAKAHVKPALDGMHGHPKKSPVCEHNAYKHLCPECKDLLRPEAMSPQTLALFENEPTPPATRIPFAGEFGEAEPVRGRTLYAVSVDDEQPYLGGPNVLAPRGRMQDGKVMTFEEVKEALEEGAAERAEAEKRRPKR